MTRPVPAESADAGAVNNEQAAPAVDSVKAAMLSRRKSGVDKDRTSKWIACVLWSAVSAGPAEQAKRRSLIACGRNLNGVLRGAGDLGPHCGAVPTAPVSPAAHAHQKYGMGVLLPCSWSRGPTWWTRNLPPAAAAVEEGGAEEVGAEEATAYGVYARQACLQPEWTLLSLAARNSSTSSVAWEINR
ncbi:hypothetical protein GCM10023193_81700 [Planotetraspora kaengkrachanensis]|uniref:Uncharacterized protein n=1 Tax=Planotetraspora kaengkrachanensis TaxID=575193 RepID=A0A8J3PZU5_9ACTN|nr:hypothetical protein Pka01_71640 [Planotetraspora kaengkrachanensis]